MNNIETILSSLAPLWFFFTIILGILMGHFSRDIYIDRKVVFLFILFTLPFIVSRGLLVFINTPQFSVSGSGVLGALYSIIYYVSIYVGRKIP